MRLDRVLALRSDQFGFARFAALTQQLIDCEKICVCFFKIMSSQRDEVKI